MKVYKANGSYLSETVYFLVEQGKAIVIDPGAPAPFLSAVLRNLGAELIAVLLTHCHADHTLGAAGFEKQGVPVYILQDEIPLLNGRANLALAIGFSAEKILSPRGLKDGEMLSLPPFSIRVIATPGHTSGGACYLIDGALFSGDTLFDHSYGRVDLPTGDEFDLICSIANELFSLPDDTPVYTGHSIDPVDPSRGESFCEALPDTYIGVEKRENPILELL